MHFTKDIFRGNTTCAITTPAIFPTHRCIIIVVGAADVKLWRKLMMRRRMLVSNSDHVLAVEEQTESDRQRAVICCCCCCYLEVCGLRIGFLLEFDPQHTWSADCLCCDKRNLSREYITITAFRILSPSASKRKFLLCYHGRYKLTALSHAENALNFVWPF